MRGAAVFIVMTGLLVGAGSPARAQSAPLALEPACQSLTPAAAGGPLPRHPDVLVVRFLGVANYELSYRGTVLLLDAAIDKLSWWAPNGVTPQEMTRRVDGIFIGHAHGEHLWDAPAIAGSTGALVVGDALATRWIRGTGAVAAAKVVTVTGLGGETFPFDGFTVEAVRGHHNVVPNDYMAKDRAAAQAVTIDGPLTPEEQDHDKRLNSLVPLTPEERQRLITEGTIAYYLSFANGFKAFYTDSAGPTTDQERALAARVGPLDLGFIPYYGGEMAIPITLEYVKLLRPSIVLPTHHDGHRNRMLDMPLGPLNLAIRQAVPGATALAPLIRTPVCINTVTREIYVGN